MRRRTVLGPPQIPVVPSPQHTLRDVRLHDRSGGCLALVGVADDDTEWIVDLTGWHPTDQQIDDLQHAFGVLRAVACQRDPALVALGPPRILTATERACLGGPF